jgi:two-component system, NtrC family, sensor kinase
VDPHQLQQVFINLINNAMQAMNASHGRGKMNITVEIGPSRFMANSTNLSPMIRILIADDGPGISADIIQRVFDPFFTTKSENEGTGLGLSVCHGIITEHQGHIWAESEAGHGATFFIELPIVTLPDHNQEGNQDQKFSQPVQITPATRVLVLEDEVNVQQVICRVLQRNGYTVDRAINGIQGLKLISKENYDLILCDIRVPQMSGPDFYKAAITKNPQLARKFIFMSGDTVSHTTREFLDQSKVEFLAKPFDLNKLVEKAVLMIEKSKP